MGDERQNDLSHHIGNWMAKWQIALIMRWKWNVFSEWIPCPNVLTLQVWKQKPYTRTNRTEGNWNAPHRTKPTTNWLIETKPTVKCRSSHTKRRLWAVKWIQNDFWKIHKCFHIKNLRSRSHTRSSRGHLNWNPARTFMRVRITLCACCCWMASVCARNRIKRQPGWKRY